MSNTVKFCGCRACRYGRTHKSESIDVRRQLRTFRRRNKQLIAKGKEPSRLVSIDYND